MAKKTSEKEQGILPGFEPNPAIKNFGLISETLGTGVVKGTFLAATEANDLSMLTSERWAEAAAGYMVKLMGGDLWRIRQKVDAACEEFWAEQRARENDAQIGYAKLRDAELEALREARATLLVRMTGHNFTVPISALAEWGNEQTEQADEWLDAIDEWNEGGANGPQPQMPEFILEHAEWLSVDKTAANAPHGNGACA